MKSHKKNQNNSNSNIIKTLAIAGLGALGTTINAQTSEDIKQFQDNYGAKPKIEQLQNVHNWMTNKQTDSLEFLIGNNKLYDLSNATIQTTPTTGLGTIQDIDGELYVNLSMVGDQEFKFENEKKFKQYMTVTFPSMFNFLETNDQESRKILSLYTGWNPEEIQIIRDRNGSVLHTKGPESSEITTTRKLANGEIISHDRWLPKDHLTENSQVSNTAYFPLTKVLERMFNYNPKIIEELNRKDITQQKALQKLEQHIDKYRDENEYLHQEKEDLEATTKELELTTDSLSHGVDSLKTLVNKWEVQVLGGIKAYNQKTDNSTNIITTPEIGIYATTIGKLGVGIIYAIPTEKELFQGVTQSRSEPDPNRPKQITHIRETSTKEYLKENQAELMVGYKPGQNFTVFGTGGLSWGDVTTKIQDNFWTERPGPDGTTHILDQQMDGVKTITENIKIPIFGAGVSYAPSNKTIGGYIRAATNHEFNKVYGSAGVNININNLLKSNNGNNGNNGNNHANTRQNQNR